MHCHCMSCTNKGGLFCPRQAEFNNPFNAPPLPALDDFNLSNWEPGGCIDPQKEEQKFIKKHLSRYDESTVKAGFITTGRQLLKEKKLILTIRIPNKSENEETETISDVYIQYESVGDLTRAIVSEEQLVIADINTGEAIELIGL